MAIKVPHPEIEADPVLFDRFHREASIGLAENLNHPAIMRVLPRKKSAVAVYMVMEWVEGRELRRILQEGRAASMKRAPSPSPSPSAMRSITSTRAASCIAISNRKTS